MNKLYRLLFSGLIAISIASCSNDNRSNDIVFLYTTDVHCGVDDNLGYSSLSAYKKEMLKEYKYVSLLDAGDYIQGDVIGAFSNGISIANIMNKMKYEVVTLGNHEFDYGIDPLSNVIKTLNADVVSCNLSYIGKKENKIKDIKPYVIKKYGNTKIGIVGITTPQTLIESTPSIFKEDNEVAYSFSGEDVASYYKCIQDNIDLCNKEADYTILLAHAGSDASTSPWGTRDIINNTNGYLAVMDGHSHFDIDWEKVKNKDNIDIPFCDAGYKLNEFGKLVIHQDGTISTELIKDYDKKDPVADKFINEELAKTKEIADRIVAHTDIALSINDEEGVRMVRNRETTIGNLVADSYRYITGSEIGFINGGGIRSDIPQGDVTYQDVFQVNPFGNYIIKKEVLGIDILNYLEFTARFTEKEYKKDGKSVGEFGGFVSCSGLRYTIDTSIPTSVVEEDGNFVEVAGPRRVKNVQVLQNDNYVDIDENKSYIISGNHFILNEGGNGSNMFVKYNELESKVIIDYDAIIGYVVDGLHGNLKDKYSSTDGRITIL